VEKISALISIITPLILLFWFYYTQRQTLSKFYFDEINGLYAGFTKPISASEDGGKVNSGIVMNIRDINNGGYFKGELDFSETTTRMEFNTVRFRLLSDRMQTFFGKMNYQIHLSKDRHPFKAEENRVYTGILYIVTRLDFLFEGNDFEKAILAEYDITHYREMGLMKFKLKQTYGKVKPNLPEQFVLNKSVGFEFEPYVNVRKIVFNGETRVDRATAL
jgi:hypothetical protein